MSFSIDLYLIHFSIESDFYKNIDLFQLSAHQVLSFSLGLFRLGLRIKLFVYSLHCQKYQTFFRFVYNFAVALVSSFQQFFYLIDLVAVKRSWSSCLKL